MTVIYGTRAFSTSVNAHAELLALAIAMRAAMEQGRH